MPKGGGFDETEDSFRYRVKDPEGFQDGSFKTIDITKGIKAVIGRLKGEKTTTVQSVIFSKDEFKTLDKAKKWLSDHPDMKEKWIPYTSASRIIKESAERQEVRDITEFWDWTEHRIHELKDPGLVCVIVKESLVPFRMDYVAAVPRKSLNNRIYTSELLKDVAPKFVGKPLLIDHDIEHCKAVTGKIEKSTWDGRAIRQSAVGLMEQDLYEKIVGTKNVPPLLRGVSIGGSGSGLPTSDGIQLTDFTPEEVSIVSFPGIPEAEIKFIIQLREKLSVKR